MNINKALQRYFTDNLKDEEYIVKSRAIVLMYYLLALFVLMICFSITLAAIYTGIYMVVSLVMTVSPLIVCCIGLLVLRKGNYERAADITIAFTTLIAIISQFYILYLMPHATFTSIIYFFFTVIIQATLFNKKLVVYIVSLLFIITNIVCFFIVKNIIRGEILELSKVGIVDSTFAMTGAFLLSILIKKITDEALFRAKEEGEVNIRQLKQIKIMMESMKSSMKKLSLSSRGLTEISKNISDNSLNQASSVEEVMASMEEISTSTESIAEWMVTQTSDMSTLSNKVDSLSEAMKDMEKKVITAISNAENVTRIAHSGEESMQSLSRNMNVVNESSGKMSDIINLIRGISDQINLLSLNASIEAARAGDAGRGFAVVADEVSKLADRTAESLKEIYSLIESNMAEINRGLDIREETVRLFNAIITGVESISSIVTDIFEFMKLQKSINNEVNENVIRIKKQSEDISFATQEQKNAMSEVVSSVVEVNNSSQLNSEEAKKLLDEAGKASALAEELADKSI